MEGYCSLKGLFKEAKRMINLYLDEEVVKEIGNHELSITMARNSFVAHSVFAGHQRSVVEQVADRVFPPIIHPN